MRVFSFELDWTNGITETLEWKTDVLQSYTGAEQRISRRLTPRRIFEFSLLLDNDEKTHFEALLFHFGARDWYLPIFNEISLLQGAMRPFDASIKADFKNKDIMSGDKAVIISGFNQYEVVTINQINDGETLLSAPVTQSFNAGARIYKLKKAVLTDAPSITHINGCVCAAQMRFRISEDNKYSDNIADLPRYRSLPVLTYQPDYSESLTSQYDRLIAELDNETGIPNRLDTAKRPFFLQSFHFYGLGQSKQNALRRLFYYLRGRQRTIWISNNQSDIMPISDMQSGVFDINSAGISEFGISRGREDVVLTLKSGKSVYARIKQSAQIDKSRERLALDTKINIKQSDILLISFLTLSRLDSDDVVWEHITDSEGLTSISVNFKGVRDELE